MMLRQLQLGRRGLQLYQKGQLPEVTDGRLSAGPVDLARFLQQPATAEVQKRLLL